MRFSACALALVAVTAPIASCAPTNPFDPATPADQQKPAQVHGLVSDSAGPVTGAVVAIGSSTATTKADGAFALTGIAPGVVTLTATQAAHQDVARDLILVAGDDRTVDVTLTSLSDSASPDAGHISGVARKGDQVGAASPDFSGIDVAIQALGVHVSTAVDGTYALTVAAGSYELVYSAVDNVTQLKTGVDVSAGETTSVDVVTLAANPGSVSGVVTLEPLIPGVAVHGGVQVSIESTSVTTGDDDNYSITGLASGVKVLRFSKEGYEQAERTVEIVAGVLQAVDAVQLALSRGSVAGFVKLTGLVDSSGVTITLNGASGTFAGVSAPDGSFVVTGLPAGVYNVAASKAGFNTASSSSVITVVADQTVPFNDVQHPLELSATIGDFKIDGGAAFTNDPLVTLDISAVGTAPTSMKISESASFTGASTQAFVPAPTFPLSSGDGNKTVFLELFDAGGTESGPFQASIVLDTTAPTLAAIALDGGALLSSNVDGFVSASPFASDSGSGVSDMQIAIDGDSSAGFVPFTSALVLPIVPNADGLHTVTAVFRDRAGNESAPVTSSITLDRVAPVISAIAIDDGDAFAHSPVVQVTIAPDAASGDVVAMALSTDPLFPTVVFQAFSSPTSFLLAPGDGTRTVSVLLKDAAGNISLAASDSIVVDSTGPSAASVLVAGGAAVTKAQIAALDVEALDATLVRTSLTGTFAADGSDFVAVSSLPSTIDLGSGDGSKTVFAQFSDDAGNVSDVVSDSVVLDTVAPVLGSAPVLVNGDDAFSQSVSVT
ncbi:MAG TPA: carboxypeptidase regulatory-like domain-containing protein, partial [Myxococcota bacterium]